MAEDKATVMPAGGDYTTLSACEAGEQKDYVTATDYGLWEIDGDWSGGADTTKTLVSGSTTSIDYYIKIRTTATARHNGVWSTSYYILTTSASWSITLEIDDNHVFVEGLQCSNTSGDNPDCVKYDGSGEFRLSHCIVQTGRFLVQLNDGMVAGATMKVWNNIFYDWATNGIRAYAAADSGTVIIYNNTYFNDISGAGIGIYVQNATALYLKNNLCNYGTNAYTCYSLLSNASQTTDNNLSEDATSPDDAHDSKTVVFVNEGGDDFHLDSSDTEAIGNGTDLSTDSDGQLSFSDDIDEETRVAWDIGADEYIAVGGGNAPTGALQGALAGSLGGPI